MIFQPIVIHASQFGEDEHDIIHLSCFYGIMLFNSTAKDNETIANAYSVISLFSSLAAQFDILEVQKPQFIEESKAD